MLSKYEKSIIQPKAQKTQFIKTHLKVTQYQLREECPCASTQSIKVQPSRRLCTWQRLKTPFYPTPNPGV